MTKQTNDIENPDNDKINIHKGIHTLTGYTKYPHKPKSIFGYDEIVKSTGRTEDIVGSGRFTYGTKCEPVENRHAVAENLNREFKIGAAHARYQTDGTFYNLMDAYPGVLFDLYGWVVLDKGQAIGYTTAKLNKEINDIKTKIQENSNIIGFGAENFMKNLRIKLEKLENEKTNFINKAMK